jgi:transcriptional regulator with XRE-family HTH domain
MDYERLASELVRKLRGARSQPALSRRLGYHANVVYLWESGRRFPPASGLFRLAARSQLEPTLLARWLGAAAPALLPSWSARHTGQLLSLLAPGVLASELSRSLGVDRGTVARWLSGRTEPRLPVLLRLVDKVSHRLVELIELFCDPAQLPVLASLYRDLKAQERLAYDAPSSHLVMRALELDAYQALPRHQPGLIAAATGLTLAEEEHYLSALKQAGQVRRDRAGLYRVARVLTLDTRRDPERNRRLKRHFAAAALARLETLPSPARSLFSYNLFCASRADLEQIRELHVEYFERMRRIVAASKQADHVVLINQQLVLLDE